ncbi:MAG: hypothetical protein PHG00_00020 [Methylococcales bacterium]|nr:hypothetical protein [Methylococcales bacterium]
MLKAIASMPINWLRQVNEKPTFSNTRIEARLLWCAKAIKRSKPSV